MAGCSTGCCPAVEQCSSAWLDRARSYFAGCQPEQQRETSSGGNADDHGPGGRPQRVADDRADDRSDRLLDAADERIRDVEDTLRAAREVQIVADVGSRKSPKFG